MQELLTAPPALTGPSEEGGCCHRNASDLEIRLVALPKSTVALSLCSTFYARGHIGSKSGENNLTDQYRLAAGRLESSFAEAGTN